MNSLRIWIRNNCNLTILLSLFHSALDEAAGEYFQWLNQHSHAGIMISFFPTRLITWSLLFSPPHLSLLRWMLINAIGYVKWAVHLRTAPWWVHLFPWQKEKRKYFEESELSISRQFTGAESRSPSWNASDCYPVSSSSHKWLHHEISHHLPR